MKTTISKVASGQNLLSQEAEESIKKIMTGQSNDIEIAAFLTALKIKGETPEEIAAFAKVMREFAVKIQPIVEGRLVDLCGSGGDASGTFNISTTAMFIVAGTGIAVAKHGNRAMSSKCGSADVLEALGVNINADIELIKKSIEEIGVGFMFAPQHHAAMKHVISARKGLGFRTVFNILGPLTNPANATAHLMGVYDPELTEKIAEVFRILGIENALVVNGEPGMDELSLAGKTRVSELKEGIVNTYYITPEELGLHRCHPKDLLGGTPDINAEILKNILSGEEKGPKRDIALLNAAAGIVVGGKAEDLEEGLAAAEDALDSGAAAKKLEDLVRYCGR
jgi:anthranilate phosphoribosyltransferase